MSALLLVGMVVCILSAIVVILSGETNGQRAVCLIPLAGFVTCLVVFAHVADREVEARRRQAERDASECVAKGGTPIPTGGAGLDILCALP